MDLLDAQAQGTALAMMAARSHPVLPPLYEIPLDCTCGATDTYRTRTPEGYPVGKAVVPCGTDDCRQWLHVAGEGRELGAVL